MCTIIRQSSRFAIIASLILTIAPALAGAAEPNVGGIADSAGFHGGLVVQVGAGDLSAVESLGGTGRFLVQVLDANPRAIEEMRRALQVAGLYGLVAADVCEGGGRLPYAENLVNILVLEAAAKIDAAEALRVVCPGGTVVAHSAAVSRDALKTAGFEEPRALGANRVWLVARKPWPAEMDFWPQPRHGADGNVVSRDKLVGPPRRIRWIAGPAQEISNMVSSAGRNFYGGVLARDSFNGLRLWQQRLTPSPARGGFKFGYGLKALGPKPFAVGSLLIAFTDEKVVALDGATGKLVREYTAGAPLEMLESRGLLLAADAAGLKAVEVETGQLRWNYKAVDPRYVVAGDGGVYLTEGDGKDRAGAIVALDLGSGRGRWRQEYAWAKRVRNLVYHNGALACEISTLTNDKQGNAIEVLSAADGRAVHSSAFLPATSHWQQARAIFVNQLMWAQAKEGWIGIDWLSGQTKCTYRAGTGHCFPPVATVRYLLAGEMHLTDLSTGEVDINPITKGNCSRDGGFMPANGLIYTAPKHCVCWPMVRGYTALAPAEAAAETETEASSALQRGPATAPQSAPAATAADWPCYRHDEWRSGSSEMAVPTQLAVKWSRKLALRPQGPIADEWRDDPYTRAPITAPVIAGGRVYVAKPDSHEVLSLDAATGEQRWHFTADGRIDTPPTIHKGLCLFGSSCGYVYCLRADDGGLVWRFRAAPAEQRIVVYGQLESPWPVPGSILLVDDVAYVAAGRHSLADGGIQVYALRPASGEVIWSKHLDTVPQKNFYSSSGLEFDNFDLLYREENSVTMSRWLFDRGTGNVTCRPRSGFAHLVTGGYGVIVPRGFWSYAPREESEKTSDRPFLRPLLSFRDNIVYGLSEDRKTVFRREFSADEIQSFDRVWFKGWTTYTKARDGGDLWRTQRLARDAKWVEPAFPNFERQHRGGAIVMAANAVLVASQQGGLTVLRPEDGTVLSELDIPPVAWDGMAIAESRVYISTADGQLLCLEGK